MRVELHPEARLELFDAAHYRAIQPALGERFIESVVSVVESIRDSPLLWTEIEQDVRRKLTRVFPHAVLYTLEQDHILIVAVMHCHQQPGYWRSRRTGG